ncbi:MAG TPA: VCBS repeat-containing protein [Chryseolinea sp.]|nr:VCBS repeat-containing protein [Chryseolinea sp.]
MKLTQGCIAALFLILVATACQKTDHQFRRVLSSESGVTFRNELTPSVDFNILNYMYFYNGGGVAIADLNGDGLSDLYFTANQTDNKLCLNEGAMRFRDITEASGTKGLSGWATGVTTADVNADGRLDIYVSYVGDYLIYKGRNQLFVNQGNDAQGVPQFLDATADYGLDLIGFSTQAAFLDYDLDGDLDMFMLTHSLHEQGTFGRSSLRKTIHPLAGDKLLRNDNGRFVDVTVQSGIYGSVIGYGLGLSISDINLDGWPDIYVGNDFHENDYLYINQGNGTFVESIEQEMPHTSRFTMGVDCGDINNDAFPDVITMDMLPEDPEILKKSAAEDAYDVYTYKANFGYHHQFARNNLQLNNRDSTFSDIALLAGVYATDWSWSSLLADFDLDGYKDIFISNGIRRRPNDLDYINFIGADSIRYRLQESIKENDLNYINRMPELKISNFMYQNNHDLTFSNQTTSWGLDAPSYSNGSAYGDLDNDGDLDLVINNVDDEAFIYENQAIQSDLKDGARYLQVSLDGAQGNKFGVGTKVLLYDSGVVQMQELFPTRGFQSAVDYVMTFGAPTAFIDSVVIVWSGGAYQRLTRVPTDQRLTVHESDARQRYDYSIHHTGKRIFAMEAELIPYRHRENNFVEFTREQLLPHMLSSEGPAAAVGDVNLDGLDDLFLGGGKWQEASLFAQQPNGKFVRLSQPDISRDSTYEDVDAIFFDADKDHDADLFVVSGGNEFSGKSPYRNPRLYVNDGKGNFTRSDQFKDIFMNGSTVAAGDYDRDGDVDLFVGARSIPFNYGKRPDSYLLNNDGKGNFSDVTDADAPALRKMAFVKHGVWCDVDGDKDDDLVVAAEWSPLIILYNDHGKLKPMGLEGSGLEQSNGWWNVVCPFDADNDGDLDFMLGNMGLNSKLHASIEEPVRMYVADFDKNDSIDQIVTHYLHGKEYPMHTRDEIMKQMPSLKKRFLSYTSFAQASLTDLFSKHDLDKSEQYTAYTFASSFVENLGNGTFLMRPLSLQAQFSTTNAFVVADFNRDNRPDIISAGNFYLNNIQLGRYDASYGLAMAGGEGNTFMPLPSGSSGLSIRGQTRKIREIVVGGKRYYLAVRNNDTVQAFSLKH